MTKNKNKKSSEAAKQEAFKLSDGICYCKTPGNFPVLHLQAGEENHQASEKGNDEDGMLKPCIHGEMPDFC